jgi:hypothetical protein
MLIICCGVQILKELYLLWNAYFKISMIISFVAKDDFKYLLEIYCDFYGNEKNYNIVLSIICKNINFFHVEFHTR